MSSTRPKSHPGPASPSDRHMSISKLQQENQSLKRRLVQYAATLEQLTGHAKREISSSARARDDAMSAAADAAALRQSVAELTATRERAERAAREAHAALAERTTALSRATDEVNRLRMRLTEADNDRASLREARDALVLAERRSIASEADARSQADRVASLEKKVSEAADRIAAAERVSRELSDVARHRDDLADKADRASREVSAATQRDAHARAQISRLKDDVERLERESSSLRTALDERGRAHAAAEERARITERELSASESAHRELQSQADDTITALRKELDEVLKELSDRNSELAEHRTIAARELDATGAVEERDSLRINVRDLQEELEQSTEMLTRAAIDALGDKSRIRKLEDALSRTRDELAVERRERSTRDSKIAGLVEEVNTYEQQLDSLRAAKRSLTDECHAYQMQIHEKDNLLATKIKELEKVGTEKKDRSFHADRLSLELSNSKNALAKRESDHVNLSTEYNEVCEQLKTVTKDAEDLHFEVGHARRELAKTTDQLAVTTQEKERLQDAATELQSARRQVQDLTSSVAEKEEELSTVKRWYSTLKTEVGESSREKKRLSDMLSEVSTELQRANHELDLLRNLRKEQEALASRISHISENSTRELNVLKQTQSEQAERLARNTVDEYQRRLEALQMAAKDDIAQTVAEQLRHDIMPHLMSVVDAKTKRMVHALARHVETFTIDDAEGSFASSRHNYASQRSNEVDDADNVESLHPSNTNIATASGTSSGTRAPGALSPSASASDSAYRSGVPSYQPSQAPPSTAESRWASVLDASRVESGEGSTVPASTSAPDTLRSPGVSMGQSGPLGDGVSVPSPTETPTEGRSEIVDDDGTGHVSASRDILGTSESPEDPSLAELASAKPETPSASGPASDAGSLKEGSKPDAAAEEPVDTQGAGEASASRGLDEVAAAGDDEGHEQNDDEEVEELDITENNGERDDDDDDDVGVDIEVEFDPREFMRKGVFASVVEKLVNDDYDDFEEMEGSFEGEEDEDEEEERNEGEEKHDEGEEKHVQGEEAGEADKSRPREEEENKPVEGHEGERIDDDHGVDSQTTNVSEHDDNQPPSQTRDFRVGSHDPGPSQSDEDMHGDEEQAIQQDLQDHSDEEEPIETVVSHAEDDDYEMAVPHITHEEDLEDNEFDDSLPPHDNDSFEEDIEDHDDEHTFDDALLHHRPDTHDEDIGQHDNDDLDEYRMAQHTDDDPYDGDAIGHDEGLHHDEDFHHDDNYRYEDVEQPHSVDENVVYDEPVPVDGTPDDSIGGAEHGVGERELGPGEIEGSYDFHDDGGEPEPVNTSGLYSADPSTGIPGSTSGTLDDEDGSHAASVSESREVSATHYSDVEEEEDDGPPESLTHTHDTEPEHVSGDDHEAGGKGSHAFDENIPMEERDSRELNVIAGDDDDNDSHKEAIQDDLHRTNSGEASTTQGLSDHDSLGYDPKGVTGAEQEVSDDSANDNRTEDMPITIDTSQIDDPPHDTVTGEHEDHEAQMHDPHYDENFDDHETSAGGALPLGPEYVEDYGDDHDSHGEMYGMHGDDDEGEYEAEHEIDEEDFDDEEPSGEVSMGGEGSSVGGGVMYLRNVAYNADGEVLDAQLMEPRSEHGEFEDDGYDDEEGDEFDNDNENMESGHDDDIVSGVEPEVRIETTTTSVEYMMPSAHSRPSGVTVTETSTTMVMPEEAVMGPGAYDEAEDDDDTTMDDERWRSEHYGSSSASSSGHAAYGGTAPALTRGIVPPPALQQYAPPPAPLGGDGAAIRTSASAVRRSAAHVAAVATEQAAARVAAAAAALSRAGNGAAAGAEGVHPLSTGAAHSVQSVAARFEAGEAEHGAGSADYGEGSS